MSRYLNQKYAGLDVYTPGEQPQDKHYVKLNTNESPYAAAPQVAAAIGRQELEDLRLYSDPTCAPLLRALADAYDVEPENVYVSNGSDDILNFAFMIFSGSPGAVIYPEISYGFYPVYADLYGIRAEAVPLLDDYSIDYRHYCHRDQMIVLANPNAPTGIALPLWQIEEIVRTNPDHVVLIDEAYVDFGAESAVRLTKKYDNLLVVQTFSKSRSLAGARLGFAIAGRGLIEDLNRIKYATNPYNINRLTMKAGIAALEASAYYAENCAMIRKTRLETEDGLRALGFCVLPSQANFVFAEHPSYDGAELYRRLKERGILVRHFSNPKISNFNRITIGTPEQMQLLVQTVRDLLRGE